MIMDNKPYDRSSNILTGVTGSQNTIKGKRQHKFLSSDLKETLKQLIEVYYKNFISVLLREILSPKLSNCSPSWINF